MARSAKITFRWAALLLCFAAIAGCAHPHETDDERIRRQAAEDARQVRHDAQQAGTVARQEARKVGQQARDIVAGVKEGWQEGAPPPGSPGSKGARVNLNTASVAALEALPGISTPAAKRIVRNRPYSATDDLVSRGLLTRAQYDRVADRVAVHGN